MTGASWLVLASDRYVVHVQAVKGKVGVNVVAASNTGPTIARGEGSSFEEACKAAREHLEYMERHGWRVVDGRIELR